MEFFTLLTIAYVMNGHQLEAKIWFENESDCWSVLLKNETLYDQINGEAGWCDVSEVPSKLIRPKIRPQN
jgi:hypothetical protein